MLNSAQRDKEARYNLWKLQLSGLEMETGIWGQHEKWTMEEAKDQPLTKLGLESFTPTSCGKSLHPLTRSKMTCKAEKLINKSSKIQIYLQLSFVSTENQTLSRDSRLGIQDPVVLSDLDLRWSHKKNKKALIEPYNTEICSTYQLVVLKGNLQ